MSVNLPLPPVRVGSVLWPGLFLWQRKFGTDWVTCAVLSYLPVLLGDASKEAVSAMGFVPFADLQNYKQS